VSYQDFLEEYFFDSNAVWGEVPGFPLPILVFSLRGVWGARYAKGCPLGSIFAGGLGKERPFELFSKKRTSICCLNSIFSESTVSTKISGSLNSF
jgi:hypothetical protein